MVALVARSWLRSLVGPAEAEPSSARPPIGNEVVGQVHAHAPPRVLCRMGQVDAMGARRCSWERRVEVTWEPR